VDEPKSLNEIDHRFLDFIWKKKRPRLSRVRKKALKSGVLMFSDLQIVTSLAILSAGFSQLHCGMSSYHWQIMVYTAWFSSVTHLTTLTALRHYFRKSSWKILAVRVILMLFTVSMLTAALIPTGSAYWLWSSLEQSTFYGAVPAKCYFNELRRRGRLSVSADQTSSMIISIFILWTSYLTRITKLYPELSKRARQYLRNKPLKILEDAIDSTNSGWWRIASDFLTIQLILLRAFFDLYNSMLWEVCAAFRFSNNENNKTP
jgi:hypothetical protein